MDKKNWKAPEIEATDLSDTQANPYEGTVPDGTVYEDKCGTYDGMKIS